MNTYRAHVFSHVGNSRTQHQDNYLVGNHTFLSEELRDVMTIANSLHCEEAELQSGGYCAFVCDGMGGHAHGEVASLTAVQLLRRHNARLLQAAAVSTEAIQDIVSRMNYEFCQIAASKHEFRTLFDYFNRRNDDIFRRDKKNRRCRKRSDKICSLSCMYYSTNFDLSIHIFANITSNFISITKELHIAVPFMKKIYKRRASGSLNACRGLRRHRSCGRRRPGLRRIRRWNGHR